MIYNINMNFIFQNTASGNLNKETVLVINKDNKKKIILNFPDNRFVNFKEKYNKFLDKLNGIEEVDKINNYKYILSSKGDYEIYEYFSFIFY
jgi:hypothetical protein